MLLSLALVVIFLTNYVTLQLFLNLLDRHDYEYFIGDDDHKARVDSFFVYDAKIGENTKRSKNDKTFEASMEKALRRKTTRHDRIASNATKKTQESTKSYINDTSSLPDDRAFLTSINEESDYMIDEHMDMPEIN